MESGQPNSPRCQLTCNEQLEVFWKRPEDGCSYRFEIGSRKHLHSGLMS